MRNKITKIVLLLSMIIICGLMGCAWSPTTENEEESTKEQLREQLPEWYAQVWLDVMLTGGGGLNVGLRRAFEDELLKDVYVANYPQFNGAIGAARLAQEQYQE